MTIERRLVLMRHATAEGGTGSVSDYGRALSPQGQGEALKVARALREARFVPNVVLCSDALRTRQTWEIAQKAWRTQIAVYHVGEFYGGDLGAIRRALRKVPDEVKSLLLIGHNPGWEAAASFLCSETVRLAPASAAWMEGEGPTWDDAIAEPGSLVLADLLRA